MTRVLRRILFGAGLGLLTASTARALPPPDDFAAPYFSYHAFLDDNRPSLGDFYYFVGNDPLQAGYHAVGTPARNAFVDVTASAPFRLSVSATSDGVCVQNDYCEVVAFAELRANYYIFAKDEASYDALAAYLASNVGPNGQSIGVTIIGAGQINAVPPESGVPGGGMSWVGVDGAFSSLMRQYQGWYDSPKTSPTLAAFGCEATGYAPGYEGNYGHYAGDFPNGFVGLDSGCGPYDFNFAIGGAIEPTQFGDPDDTEITYAFMGTVLLDAQVTMGTEGSMSAWIDPVFSLAPDFKGDPANYTFVVGGIVQPGGPVPEPASWALMIAGFSLIGGSLRTTRAGLRRAFQSGSVRSNGPSSLQFCGGTTMKHILFGVTLVSSSLLVASAAGATTVDATASVYSSGSGSTPAVVFDISAFSAIKISASGLITLSPPFFNDPDGVGSLDIPPNITGVDGLSGIAQAYAGGLVGVFETATGPAPGDPEPATLSYGTADLGFSSFSPLLNQVFFVGDGLTGDGTGAAQTFYVPTGATRLLLGFADALGYQGEPDGYFDNEGSLEVGVSGAVPEPASWAMMLGGFMALGGTLRRRKVTGAAGAALA